jgi:hypothetical protein
MSRKKISTTIYVTPEQSDRLKLLHERTKVPVAVYIREGIDLVLRQYEHLLPGQLPLGAPRAVAPAEPLFAAPFANPAANPAAIPAAREANGALRDDSEPPSSQVPQAGASAGRVAPAAAAAAKK